MKTRWIILLSAVMVGLLATAIHAQSSKQATQAFMRMKLVYSQAILEGLTLENYGLIMVNAKNLDDMTVSNVWSHLRYPAYVKGTREYQDRVNDLLKAAREVDLKKSTRAFTKVLQSCVDCHRQLRVEQGSGKVK